MSTLITMVGIPGSQKSTQAKILAEQYNATILSSDEYRKKFLGSEEDQSNNELVFQKLHKDTKELISKGENVILDATHITIKSRRTILDMCKYTEDFKAIAYIMNTSLTTCVINDSARERTVGKKVIVDGTFRFQIPMKYEGYNEIIFHSMPTDYNAQKAYKLRQKMYEFDQKNSHHIYNLGEHCDKLADCYPASSIQSIAGMWHDVGKLFSQTFDEDGVAHYIGHDSVGAYYLAANLDLLPLENVDEVLEILWYVNFHMRFHNDYVGEKAKQKYSRLFGEKRFKEGLQFAEFDKIASGTCETYNKEIIEWN